MQDIIVGTLICIVTATVMYRKFKKQKEEFKEIESSTFNTDIKASILDDLIVMKSPAAPINDTYFGSVLLRDVVYVDFNTIRPIQLALAKRATVVYDYGYDLIYLLSSHVVYMLTGFVVWLIYYYNFAFLEQCELLLLYVSYMYGSLCLGEYIVERHCDKAITDNHQRVKFKSYLISKLRQRHFLRRMFLKMRISRLY